MCQEAVDFYQYSNHLKKALEYYAEEKSQSIKESSNILTLVYMGDYKHAANFEKLDHKFQVHAIDKPDSNAIKYYEKFRELSDDEAVIVICDYLLSIF